MTATDGLNILKIDSSGRAGGSASRALGEDLVHALEQRYGGATVTRRDLANGIALVDEDWITANFTPAEERDADQRSKLSESDALVAELQAADVIVIGAPIYNFSIPAALKAWVDMIARARLTFRYTETGPVGLLQNKKAYIVIASGGVAVDDSADFATPYLRQVLRFVGIDDVSVIAAERINARGDVALDDARVQIADVIHAGPALDLSAA